MEVVVHYNFKLQKSHKNNFDAVSSLPPIWFQSKGHVFDHW